MEHESVVVAGEPVSTDLVVLAGEDAQRGSTTLTITGTGGGLVRTAQVTLQIKK